MSRHAPSRPAALAALLLLTTACAASPRAAGPPASSPSRTMLVVRNHNFSDMNVYAATGGTRARLGIAPGESTTRFTLPAWAVSGQLQVLGDPIGGSGTARSGPLVVTGGDTVTFTIEQDLALSMATVR